jgi:hypothetical protein
MASTPHHNDILDLHPHLTINRSEIFNSFYQMRDDFHQNCQLQQPKQQPLVAVCIQQLQDVQMHHSRYWIAMQGIFKHWFGRVGLLLVLLPYASLR